MRFIGWTKWLRGAIHRWCATLESQAIPQASWERHLLQESVEYIQERMEASFLKNDGRSWIAYSKKRGRYHR